MTKWKIPLYKILSDKDDEIAVAKVIKRGTDWALGQEIEQFERALSKYVGCDYCVAFNSGTSALHAGLKALDISPNNEVIVPSFTFIATVNSVLFINGIPKFVDIEEETLGLDPIKVESSINKKTQAIIPIHYGGSMCKIDELKKIAQRRKIKLIEDAAESLGAYKNKKMAGTFGDISIFSFAGNKVLTTGEGGCILTNSKKLFERLKLIRSHGRLENQNYFNSSLKPNYVSLGYNWRMSSITAALGLSQLGKIEKLIQYRRKHAKFLSSYLKKFSQIITPNEQRGSRHVYQLYSIRMQNKKIRDQLTKFLTKKRIMSKVFFYPVHQTKFYQSLGYNVKNNLEKTNIISDQILTLPMYPGLGKEDLVYICESLAEFMENQ